MKFSKSEKVLIVILLVLLIFFGGGALLIYPQFLTITSKTTEFILKSQEKVTVTNKLARLPTLDEKLKTAYDESLTASKRFFTQMPPTDVERLITGFVVSHNAVLDSITVNAAEIAALDTYTYQYTGIEYPVFGKATAGSSAAAAPAPTQTAQDIAKTSVSVSFGCDYSDLKNILDEIYAQERTLYISSCSVSEIQNGFVKCAMVIDLYSVNKIPEPAYD